MRCRICSGRLSGDELAERTADDVGQHALARATVMFLRAELLQPCFGQHGGQGGTRGQPGLCRLFKGENGAP